VSTVVIDPNAAPADSTVQVAASPRTVYADWPQKADERAQPWDHDKNGSSREDRDKLLDNPGTPNTVTPTVSHSMPMLSSGSGGDSAWAVGELARRLHILGYHTDVGEGTNPFSVLTQSVMSAVERFREDHNVSEDPSGFGGNTAAGRARAGAHVGPWTWEAIIRASERELAKVAT
jgi:hypothetical protein